MAYLQFAHASPTGKVSFAVIALSVFMNLASADIITVCESGCDHITISDAIDNATNGDVIQLSEQTYEPEAAIDPQGLAITIKGVSDNDGDGLPETIIDGNSIRRIFVCSNGETSKTVFQHLVIQNGSNRDGGGMYISNASSPTIDDCHFRWNRSKSGAGIYSDRDCNPTLNNCRFIENEASAAGGGMYTFRCSPTFNDCAFIANQAIYGGGLYDNNVNSNTPTLENCSFIDNFATYGGGYYCYRSNAQVTNCTFTGNTATNDAGGMLNVQNQSILISCTFTENSSDFGGGLCNGNSSPELIDCTISDNSGYSSGGGMYNICSNPRIQSSIICGNTVGPVESESATDENQIENDGCDQYVDGGENCIAGNCDDCYSDDEGCGSSDGAPVENPAWNADGTRTYWVGNNMQWEIQEAIDDCSPGDIIVIRCGDYVNSISINKPNITIRPFVNAAGQWEPVNFWNPTQGPEAQNGWAIHLGPDTENTYIGRPRQFRQLPNGYISETTIVPGEYSADSDIEGKEVDEIGGTCFTFWSRSVDNTGLLSDNGKATIENCVFTSQNGFGGGVILTGDENDTSFVQCSFDNLYADGSTLRTDVEGLDLPNYCIAVHAAAGIMEYTFSNCFISNNRGSTILYQNGGGGAWNNCQFNLNQADSNFSGTVTLLGCNPHFASCDFNSNLSGYGTIFMNGEGVSSLDGVRFTKCNFTGNNTIDGQWGGVIYAIDSKDATGTAPKVMFDNCDMNLNNNNLDVNQDDFVTPYFPAYRQGKGNEQALGSEAGPCIPSADINGDGLVDGADLGIVFALWGTNGTL